MERVSSFKYLGVNISEDLTWTAHIQTQVKKARQRLYHLRQLRKFRVSPAILKIFYSGAIESVSAQCGLQMASISTATPCRQWCVWLSASQGLVFSLYRTFTSNVSHLFGSIVFAVFYFKRCKSRAAKIIKDSNHIDNSLFILLPSGKHFRSIMAKTERLRRTFFPQAIRLLNKLSLHL